MASERSEARETLGIEITPEMIEAGAAFLCDHYPEETGVSFCDRAMARELFLTMWNARRENLREDAASEQHSAIPK